MIADSLEPEILVLSGIRAWPADSGGRQRLWNTLRALSTVGNVDLLAPKPAAGAPTGVYNDLVVDRLPQHVSRRVNSVLGAVRNRLPRGVAAAMASRRALLAGVDLSRYDLLYVTDHAFHKALPHTRPPTVFDFYDREDHKAQQNADQARNLARKVVHAADAALWRRLTYEICNTSDQCYVCSEADGAGLPGRIVVLPNGYELAGNEPVVRRRPGVTAFVGHMGYPPNAAAVAWFLSEVLPHSRRVVETRIIGKMGGRHLIPEGVDASRVVITGEVPRIEPELAQATVAVVPLLTGSGSRIKILEAFAHGLPVVSTTVGASGLAVRDGEHLLIADDPADFATKLDALLADEPLRAALALRARELWASEYQWAAIRERLSKQMRGLLEQNRT